MTTILQGSDVHFGKPHDRAADEALLAKAREIRPDVVVIAGDLTQRAKRAEFAEARAFIDRTSEELGVPVVVTAGNHDVALYRVWERFGYPFRNYREIVHDRLDYAVEAAGGIFVSLNTAAPRRAIVNGRMRDDQLVFAARVFQENPQAAFRCVVMHHALASPPDGGSDSPVPGSGRIVERFQTMDVDVVFSGHFHRAYAIRPRPGGPVLSHSGTATSTRGRRGEKGMNSFNRVVLGDDGVSVTRYLRTGTGAFEETWTERFPRVTVGSGGVE